MNIITLFNEFTKDFNKVFNNSFNPLDIERNISLVTESFSIKLYTSFLEYLDAKFKKSEYRKLNYHVKETSNRSLLTSIGYITIKITRYVHKDTNKSYTFIRDILNLKPYQRITDYAEYTLVKYSIETNMSQAAKYAIKNTPISRSILSKKIKNYNGSFHENIVKSKLTPSSLFIEMDEIHANLQRNSSSKGSNHICPCAIVHEGHKDLYSKRKELKNVRNFASSTLNYEELWYVIYDYVNKKYDIDKFNYIFVSGDGAHGIKQFVNVFPNAIYVLDKFHYKKALKYIFKKETSLINIADSYIRHNLLDDFKTLVQCQIDKYPNQEKHMIDKQNYILNNIDGIINQNHEFYTTPCSMEGHISNRYARFITSSPYAFSNKGLENKLKLLVLNANKHDLTYDEFLNLKYSSNEYEDIIKNINELTNIKYDIKLTKNYTVPFVPITSILPVFNDTFLNNYFYTISHPNKFTKYT